MIEKQHDDTEQEEGSRAKKRINSVFFYPLTISLTVGAVATILRWYYRATLSVEFENWQVASMAFAGLSFNVVLVTLLLVGVLISMLSVNLMSRRVCIVVCSTMVLSVVIWFGVLLSESTPEWWSGL